MEELHTLPKLEASATRANRKTTAVDMATLKRSDRIKKLKQYAEAATAPAKEAAANEAATAEQEASVKRNKVPPTRLP
jgi:hypothetical protein